MKNKDTLKWILHHGRTSLAIIIVLTMMSVILSLIQVRFATASKNVMDIATKVTEGTLSSAFLLLVFLLILRLIIQIATNYLNVHASYKLEISIKRHLFKTLINKDYLSVAKFHSGELLNRINSDVSVIVSGIIANFALRTRGLSFPLIKEILRGTSNDFRNRGIPIGKGSHSTALF